MIRHSTLFGGIAIAAQLALAGGVAMRGSPLLAVPLLLPLYPMARGVPRAHAANTLLVLFYLGVCLTLGDAAGRWMAAAAALAFVACVMFVRIRRRETAPAARTESSAGAVR